MNIHVIKEYVYLATTLVVSYVLATHFVWSNFWSIFTALLIFISTLYLNKIIHRNKARFAVWVVVAIMAFVYNMKEEPTKASDFTCVYPPYEIDEVIAEGSKKNIIKHYTVDNFNGFIAYNEFELLYYDAQRKTIEQTMEFSNSGYNISSATFYDGYLYIAINRTSTQFAESRILKVRPENLSIILYGINTFSYKSSDHQLEVTTRGDKLYVAELIADDYQTEVMNQNGLRDSVLYIQSDIFSLNETQIYDLTLVQEGTMTYLYRPDQRILLMDHLTNLPVGHYSTTDDIYVLNNKISSTTSGSGDYAINQYDLNGTLVKTLEHQTNNFKENFFWKNEQLIQYNLFRISTIKDDGETECIVPYQLIDPNALIAYTSNQVVQLKETNYDVPIKYESPKSGYMYFIPATILCVMTVRKRTYTKFDFPKQ